MIATVVTHAKKIHQRLVDLSRGITSKRSSKWPAVEHAHRKLFPTCAACGTADSIQVHHCLPFHLHPELELDPNNLISLCEKKGGLECHYNIGHHRDWKSYNPLVRADASTALNRRASS